MKKLQVFVSSTYVDLIEERQKAVEGILRAGHIPAGMELFTGANKSQWNIIEEWIKESDILMLIFGGKYGSVETESGKSYTQLEYEFALEQGIPVFAIVLDDHYLINKKSKNMSLPVYERDLPKPEIEKYNDFKKTVESNYVKFIGDINQITGEVALVLQDFMRKDLTEHHFRGWIRGTESSNETVVSSNLNANSNNKLLELDEALLNQVITMIEGEHLIDQIDYIASNCFYMPETKNKLNELIHLSKEPSKRFFNEDLQGLFKKLVARLEAFTGFLSVHFFPKGTVDRYYLYPDLNMDFNFVKKELSDRYDKYVRELHIICDQTIEEIENFVHSSRVALYNR